MPQISIAIKNCSGSCQHAIITASIPNGNSKTWAVHRSEFLKSTNDIDEAQEYLLAIMRHVGKKAGAATPAQWKAAIEGEGTYYL